MAQIQTSSRLSHIDGLRALAALFVVAHHIFAVAYPNDHTGGLWWPLTRGGHFAVVVFFVLSGYSLAIGSARHGHRLSNGSLAFFKRRAWRIVPPYLAALTLSVVLALTVLRHKTGSEWDQVLPVSWASVAAYGLLLQDFVQPGTLTAPNYVFWSISIEFHTYFLFPLLLLIRRASAGAIRLLYFSSLFALAAFIQVARGSNFLQYDFALVPVFVFGILAASVTHGETGLASRRIPWAKISLALWVIAAVFIATAPFLAIVQGLWFLDPLVGAATATLLIAFERDADSAWLKRIVGHRKLAAVGVFSYSVYLIHAPIVQLVWQSLLRPTGITGAPLFTSLAVVAMPIILLASWLFFQAFEKPFLNGSPGKHKI